MSKYRRAAAVDQNQSEIVAQLRQIPGVSVELGHDDFLLGTHGLTFWYELKNPDKISKETGQLLESAIKPDQKRLRADFRGHYKIVSSFDEILADMRDTLKKYGII